MLGATGQQGGATARHLLAAGLPIRILVRDPDKPAARELASAGAEVVVGDMLDPASLRYAFDGAHGVYSMQTWRGPGGVEAEKQAGINVAEAAAEAGVAHLVYSSVASADKSTGLAHFESKHEIEQRIADARHSGDDPAAGVLHGQLPLAGRRHPRGPARPGHQARRPVCR